MNQIDIRVRIALYVGILLAFLFVIVSVVGATPPVTVELCNPGGQLVNVPEHAVGPHLDNGWSYPVDGECPTDDDGDDNGDDGDDNGDDGDDNGDDGDDNGDDGDDNGSGTTTTNAPAQNLSATCLDIFHPFLAVNNFAPAATAQLVQNTDWAGPNTSLTEAWFTQLNIVPADYDANDRDVIRDGNDAGILCVGVLPAGPQIVAFQMPDGTVAGLVFVQEIGNSIVIHEASILRWDILSQDPLWGGVWNHGE